MKHYGPEYEKQRRKENHLQREVLAHLKERGPIHYDVLYVLFDPHKTASIQPALTDLLKYGLISMDEEKLVQVTATGLEKLADQNYWT
jgi:hypothetical protein